MLGAEVLAMTINGVQSHMLNAKVSKSDPDNPTWSHAMNSADVDAARQATFDIGNKYHQMELSDVVMKISRVVDRSSHGSSKVVTRCCQGRRGGILVVTLVVTCHEQ